MRGGKLKFERLAVLAIALGAGGEQLAETVCPACKRDIAIPLQVSQTWMAGHGNPFTKGQPNESTPRLLLPAG